MPQPLVITERDIRKHGPGNVLRVCWRQRRTERRLSKRGLRFRHSDLQKLAGVYAAMDEDEFNAINGRQDWANWRTIPRALTGHVADRPLTVLDLGCGVGSSTQVLAFYCPPGSRIIGYEFAAPLVEIAKHRTYRDSNGADADVTFCCRGVTEPFLDANGERLPSGSVDVINASGIVGHHLNKNSVPPLIAEIGRVLKQDGIAMLDVGPTLPADVLTDLMQQAGFEKLGHYKSWWFDPTGQVVYRRS